jgi:hypothetical protein
MREQGKRRRPVALRKIEPGRQTQPIGVFKFKGF